MFVRNGLQVRVENDAEEAVAAEDVRKQLGVLGSAASKDFAAGHDDRHRDDRRCDRLVQVLPSVAVHAQ